MSGLTFLFSAALWALPLAGLPLLMHLLLRRRSPVVVFPTLRFVHASVQQTAARKKVHRWLLLLLRALALLSLIWAISQPALTPTNARVGGGGKSAAAVIVIDTSYSMQLAGADATLAGQADRTVRELLAGQLRGMKVAILQSSPAPTDRPEASERLAQETFRDAGDIQWVAPLPTPAHQPLLYRIQHAAEMLQQQPVDDRWLIVVSDFQKREFPRSIPEPPGTRLVLIDLHPADVRSAAITGVRLSPEQPVPGLAGEAVVDIAGRPRDVRQVNVSTVSLDREGRTALPPAPATLDDTGHARLRLPLVLPPGEFVTVDAALTVDEPLAWAKQRRLLVQVPPRQIVTLLNVPGMSDVRQRIAWALDPTGGQDAGWAVAVREAQAIAADTDVFVHVLSEWPDAALARQLHDFVAAGHTAILFVRPGLEQTWESLPESDRQSLAALLPGLPAPSLQLASAYTATVAAPAEPVLMGLTDARFQIGAMTVRRLLPFDLLAPGTTPILGVAEAGGGGGGTRPAGLLFRRSIGSGTVFTFATLPDKHFSSLHLHPTFPPILVQMSLRPPARSDDRNVELGSPLLLSDPRHLRFPELRLEGPGGDVTVVRPAAIDGNDKAFRYNRADTPGIYTWRNPADDAVVEIANVQYPAAEAELEYTPADRLVAGDGAAVIATSADELGEKFASLSQPEPRWAIPLAAVMLLLCFEALIGSVRP